MEGDAPPGPGGSGPAQLGWGVGAFELQVKCLLMHSYFHDQSSDLDVSRGSVFIKRGDLSISGMPDASSWTHDRRAVSAANRSLCRGYTVVWAGPDPPGPGGLLQFFYIHG